MIECQSAWNTPILPVKKERGQDYRPVQYLRLVNQAAVTLHSTAANLYTLLSLLPPSAKIYTCLYLKDTFFCIHIAPVSEPIFVFEREDPAGSTKQQLTWTCLPQGFKNSPIIFGEALASDLDSFQPGRFRYWLLQYVDDLLLAAENKEPSFEEKGTDLQDGGKIFGVCPERGQKTVGPIQECSNLENPMTKNLHRSQNFGEPLGFVEF